MASVLCFSHEAVLPLFLLTLHYTLFSVKVGKLTTWQLRIYPSSCPCTIAAFQTESAQKKHFVLPLLIRRPEQQLH